MSAILLDQPSNSYLKSTKKLSEIPWVIPIHYQHINIVGVVRNYNLSRAQRIFMTFYDSRASLIGIIFRIFYKLAIVVNAIAYLISWSPPLMDTSDSCDIPACSHNELCPNKDICAPGIDAAFIKTQKLCNFIFLFEYIITASTCWSVPARLAGVLDFYFEKNKDTTSIIEADDKRTSITETPSFVNFSGRLGMKIGEMSWMSSGDIDAEIDDDPIYPPMIQICRFLTTGKNLRTMFAIFPFFIVLQFYPSVLSSVNIFFTIGRFMTLFKLTDFISSRRSSRIVNNTLLRAYPTLLYMIWTVLIVAILMSSIIFLTERGEFTVNEDYPDGAFLRPDVLQSSKEESPFKSVLVSMYYVLVTMTSTGYGDLYCTSSLGRFLSNILMCSAVFILALPIAVLGNILSEEVDNYNKRKQDRNIVVEKQLRKGRKLPTYKYRRGPSLVGAKEMVGKTIRRFSAITASPSPIQRQEKPITPKNETFALAPSALEEENVPLNRKKRVSTGSSIRRGSESGYDRRLRSSTVEKINRLSVSNIEYVESSVTLQPFGSPPGSMSDDCGEEKGIVLNPIRSSSQRSTSVSKLFQSSDQNLLKISKSQSMKSNQSDPSLLVDVQQRILDIENQIEKYSNLYHERMKDCLDIYQQIQIQMKIRNELLKSLSID